MPDSYEEIEERIQAALASVPPDKTPNIAKLAQDFAVPVSQLRARHKGRRDRSNCGEAGHSLINNQELTLCHIIKHEEVYGSYLQH